MKKNTPCLRVNDTLLPWRRRRRFLGLPLAPQASIFWAFGAQLIARGPRSNRVSHSVPPDPKARTKAPRVSSSYVASSLRFVVSDRRSNRRSGRHRSPLVDRTPHTHTRRHTDGTCSSASKPSPLRVENGRPNTPCLRANGTIPPWRRRRQFFGASPRLRPSRLALGPRGLRARVRPRRPSPR
jgi:hypothetical protein